MSDKLDKERRWRRMAENYRCDNQTAKDGQW